MLRAEEYLPIGSVVLLKNGFKKAMIIGIMQSVVTKENKELKEYDYVGVLYPEGFLNLKTLFMFQQDQITDVVFMGYENSEREEYFQTIEKNMQLLMEKTREKMNEDGGES